MTPRPSSTPSASRRSTIVTCIIIPHRVRASPVARVVHVVVNRDIRRVRGIQNAKRHAAAASLCAHFRGIDARAIARLTAIMGGQKVTGKTRTKRDARPNNAKARKALAKTLSARKPGITFAQKRKADKAARDAKRASGDSARVMHDQGMRKDTYGPLEVRYRALAKKLRQIEDLEAKAATGERLDKQQEKKVRRREYLEAEMANLKKLISGENPSDDDDEDEDEDEDEDGASDEEMASGDEEEDDDDDDEEEEDVDDDEEEDDEDEDEDDDDEESDDDEEEEDESEEEEDESE